MRGRTRLVGTVLLVAAVGSLAVVGVSRSSGPAAADPPQPAADQVVVVGIAGLRWSDVTATGTPALARLAREGSTGTLSVRSAPEVTCPAEGWLTLGAGRYAAVVDPGRSGASAGCASRLPPPVPATGPAVPTMPELRDLNDGARLGARPGMLGDHVSCTTAVGPGAALAAATAEGRVDHYRRALPQRPAELLARCPFTAIELGSVTGSRAERQRELGSLDRALARVSDGRPAGSVLVVVGVAEAEGAEPRLHVAVAHGPGFGPGWLRSPSTRRPPYVQLVDLAPTVLAVLGHDVPDDLAGRPLTGGAPGRPDSLLSATASVVDADTQAVAHRSVRGSFFGLLGGVLLATLGAVVWLLHSGRRPRPAVARGVGIAALGLAAAPVASFVAHLVPWWRAPAPMVAVVAAVTVGVLVMLVAMRAVVRVVTTRSRLPAPVGAVAALGAMTVGVFLVDALTGARLQLGSLLGYNPLVAGRFIGLGNVAFAVYAAGAVLLAAVFAAHGHRPRASVWGRLAAVAVPVVVVTGAPWWGADFGGVLTLIPTFAVLGMLLTRTRVTWWRLAAAALAAAAVVLAISWLDYLRPASTRSHFGRFVVSLLDGSAVQTIHRKLLVNMELLTMGPHTILAGLLLVVGAALVLRPPRPLRRVYRTWPVTRPTLTATVALAGFGFATNDSGIAIPVVVALVVLPMVLALCLWAAVDGPAHDRLAGASPAGASPAGASPAGARPAGVGAVGR